MREQDKPIESQNPMLVIENKEEDEVDSPEISANQMRSRSAMQIKRNLNERPVLTLD